ncbi:hypothetical protein [Pseudomonas fluorescens]|uniref:hypothetical protein n=1 Tax=Pseudomonas fluorescens TaxID=294 RepID=UPI001CD5E985|nr:hypothetical protein [Pseudomonas fluorescens]
MTQRRNRQPRIPLLNPTSRRIEHLPRDPRLRRLSSLRTPVAHAAHSEPSRIHDRECGRCVMHTGIVHRLWIAFAVG